MKQIAKDLGGRVDLNETKKDNITYIAGITTSHQKLVSGLSTFFDPLPEHWGGTDVKIMANQRWYHLTIGYGLRDEIQYKRTREGGRDPYRVTVIDNTKAPQWITIHCDNQEPGWKHFTRDWLPKRINRLPKLLPMLPPVFW